MTFLSRRKRQITRPASPGRLARKIASAALLLLALASSAPAQNYLTLESINGTPKFAPANPQPLWKGAVATGPAETPRFAPRQRVVSAIYQPGQLPFVPIKRTSGTVDDDSEPLANIDLPGPQRFFRRVSEQQFFERIAQEAKKQPGGRRAIFPEEPVISKETLTRVPDIRWDPTRRQPFPRMVELVEPGYVLHRRILFEQPNFERAGYDFGVLQPAICVGVYFYDLALLPYHACSDLQSQWDTDVGKCMPGDPSPLLIPRERFSVTGLVGQASVIMGGLYLFP